MSDGEKRAPVNHRSGAKSTGPKSPEGKRRASQNARRHGLSRPAGQECSSQLSAKIERLASLIAGVDATSERLEASRRVAEAQIDLIRVRRARADLYADPFARIKEPSFREQIRAVMAYERNPKNILAIERINEVAARLSGERAPTIESGMARLAPQLAKLDRYARRALSRKKFAVRALDALTTENP